MDRKLIYVAAKYGGDKKNKELVEKAIRYFINKDDESQTFQRKTYISPIHTFNFLYDDTEYLEGLDYCLSLLDKCDECYMLSNWKDSFGAKIEYGFCKGKSIPIKIIDIKKLEWSDF